MSGSRLSTVYDFSSLRLHPDGSRVHQTPKNLRPRNARVSVQDSRGNWFARDAAGLGIIGRYRKTRDDTEDEQIGIGGVNSDQSDYLKRNGKGKAKEKTTGRRYDGRSAKRQRFFHDFDFLETPYFNATDQPLPSSVIFARLGGAYVLFTHPIYLGSTQVHTLFCEPVLSRAGPIIQCY